MMHMKKRNSFVHIDELAAADNIHQYQPQGWLGKRRLCIPYFFLDVQWNQTAVSETSTKEQYNIVLTIFMIVNCELD